MGIFSTGRVGIKTKDPKQMLDVNGSMRLAPMTVRPADVTGSIYYNNTTNTPAYRDNATWNNFVAEYGSIIVPYTASNVTVTFRKSYLAPPIVIPTIYRLANCTTRIVWVWVANVTNTQVLFDINAYDGPDDNSADELDHATNGATEVSYIVIPR
jgi:hypothetical protein